MFLPDIIFLLVGALWLAVTGWSLLGHLNLRELPKIAEGEEKDAGPGVAIVVPVRDEAPRIERTIEGLIGQTGVRSRVTVVDDRSAAPTADLLRRLGETHSSLNVVRVDTLPAGWLGKCHACSVGANARVADEEWILFTDGDTWCHHRDVLARAVRAAETDGVDHLCLLPGLGECTVPGQAIVLFATLGMLGIAFGVNCDFPRSYTGVGAFTLIRRGAYDRIGGHERLRLEVIDDFGMGYLVKRHGMRSRLYAATGDIEVRWAHSARSFVHVVEKNMFAKLGFSVVRCGFSVALMLVILAVPLAGAIVATPAGLFALAAMGTTTIPAMWMARRYGWSPWPGLLAPLSIPILIWATLHSAWRVLRQGGIRWRDTFYSLDELRAYAAGGD